MFSKIVVPLDGSELAERVIPHVAGVARGRASQVHLLAVAPLMRSAAVSRYEAPRSVADEQGEISRAGRELTEYLGTVARRTELAVADVQVAVRFGRPAEEILAFAGEVGADLVAMSTHGRSGIGRWVFGNVAERVLRAAVCPVLMVRDIQSATGADYQRILVPLDGSDLAEQVLPYVKALIRPNHTRVCLVAVLANGLGDRTVALLTSYPPGLQLAAPALHHAEVELRVYLRSVASALRERGAVVQTVIERGSAADCILDRAARVGADLIAMTTHGVSGVSRWTYGAVASKILQGAHAPVLLVRPTPQG